MAKALQHANDGEYGGSKDKFRYEGGFPGTHDPWGGQPAVGPQEHGPPNPSHGAAGGSAIDMPWRGNPEPAAGTGAASGSALDPPIA